MSDVSAPTRYKLSIEDYHKLGETGILGEDSRVELIEGELIQMAPIGGPHMWAVTQLTQLLVLAVAGRAHVSPQNPVTLPPNSEPQPDFTVLKKIEGRDRSLPPGPGDTLLVVEVSDTTLGYDRGTKLRLYARSSIPEVWIVDVKRQRVEVYRGPSGDRYQSKTIVEKGETLQLEALPNAPIDVAAIFT